ncbi:MAG: hypothetical protein RLY49_100 [Candidatus Parcubacteria bacterium]
MLGAVVLIVLKEVAFNSDSPENTNPVLANLAPVYQCAINPSEAKRIESQPVETYHVEKKEHDQVVLLTRVNKGWLFNHKYATITITFDPSTAPPYMAECVEIDENGVPEVGRMLLKPQGDGFDFDYWDKRSYLEGRLQAVRY